ncbi:MAG: glycoside hydrolase family 3 protein, partial [Clostridia bacterium]|nr:glycoside hydrolase family 3 protein [Clostridia bacterium]
MQQEQIKHLVAQMTLEEKAGLTAGENGWWTKACERLNIPVVHMTDGPHGLRNVIEENQNMLNGNTMEAVCFPAECAMASSFDRDLLFAAGQELGREAAAAGVDILLGPGVNMKRSPLCGRNFEYFSEDPYLAGELGAAYVNGVQSEGVGTSLKHFFANNQEYRRYDSSSEPDERAMREIYLTAFETVVKKAQPWTIMASYNKINGVYSTENKTGLTHILRDEWGFQGTVISDWGATHDRAAVVSAGCDLTMPAPG